MRIALDATYSVGAEPSGIAVYSRHILDGLAHEHPSDKFLHCFRPKQFRRSVKPAARNVARRLLIPWGVRADLFHALNQRLDRRHARRTVVTFHDLFVMTGEYSSPEFRARFGRQAREAASRADIIITVSQFTASQVSELLDVEPSRIRVIPHGAEPPPPSALNTEREPMVLFIGALQARKNVSRLIAAFEILPPPWRLILAGATTGYQAEQILQVAVQSRVRERIEIAGYVSSERLHELLARASIFAFPSLDEGFGIPVLEAMAWGVPVITSNTSALAEVAGDAAITINPFEVDELARALALLAGEPQAGERLIEAGKRRAAQFPWSEAVRKTYDVYRELLL